MNLAAFFPNVSEENILERISQYHIHTGVELPLSTDFKRFIWLSNKLEKTLREEKVEADRQREEINRLLGK